MKYQEDVPMEKKIKREESATAKDELEWSWRYTDKLYIEPDDVSGLMLGVSEII
jgi:hypothetical protein